jgi:hypothetical protein
MLDALREKDFAIHWSFIYISRNSVCDYISTSKIFVMKEQGSNGFFFEKLRFVSGGLFVLMGLWIVFGRLFPVGTDRKLEIIMGLIFVFYGVYRMVYVEYRRNVQKHSVEDDDGDIVK